MDFYNNHTFSEYCQKLALLTIAKHSGYNTAIRAGKELFGMGNLCVKGILNNNRLVPDSTYIVCKEQDEKGEYFLLENEKEVRLVEEVYSEGGAPEVIQDLILSFPIAC